MNEQWMCAFCSVEITNGTHCTSCGDYKGAMEKSEWLQFIADNPRLVA